MGITTDKHTGSVAISKPGRTRLIYLAAEALTLYLILPALVAMQLIRIRPILLLLVSTCVCLIVLLRDRTFDRSQLWRVRAIREHWRKMLVVFGVGVVLISLAVWLFRPDLLFNFIQRAPRVWALVMVLYPLLSVYPQELIYRAFFFHRYRHLFSSRPLMIVANAAAFGFMHIVFENWVAVIMTFLGGLLFARTYEKTRSLSVVSIEHALYGCFILTIGLGVYFYHGAVR